MHTFLSAVLGFVHPYRLLDTMFGPIGNRTQGNAMTGGIDDFVDKLCLYVCDGVSLASGAWDERLCTHEAIRSAGSGSDMRPQGGRELGPTLWQYNYT